MSTALVTGASGFIGGHLAEKLSERGHQVKCLVRRTSNVDVLQKLDVELCFGDVTEAESVRQAVKGVDVVYNVAGLRCALRKRQLFEVNGEGVTNVARSCAEQANPPVHVLVSSIAASGPVRRGSIRQEGDVPAPVSHYGASKLAGEVAARKWAEKVPTTIVRPGIVFGPRNEECLPIFKSTYYWRVHASIGFRAPPLSVIHVDDLNEILCRAAEQGKRVNVASEVNVTEEVRAQGCYFGVDRKYPDYIEFGRIIGAAMGRKRVLVARVIPPICWIAGIASDVVQQLRRRADVVGLNKMKEALASSWATSTTAVERDLDFRSQLSIRERIQQTADWYLKHGWIGKRKRGQDT